MPAFSLQSMLAERGFRPQAQVNNIVFWQKINLTLSTFMSVELSILGIKKYNY
jgi:hypothetical protein